MNMHIKKYAQKLLQRADRQDKALSQQKRKIKWIAILGTLFILYILSFLQPHFIIQHHLMRASSGNPSIDSLRNDSSQISNSPFLLPVDSFEQLLNQQIHEDTN